jgi:cytochrome c-type biogenesis protein CcmH/NrfG
MERAAKLAPEYAEVLYDLAVIRLANKDVDGALSAVKEAIRLNPKLSKQAATDNDLAGLRENSEFQELISK